MPSPSIVFLQGTGLTESTQSVHNHQGIVVVMTLGSVNEVHIKQCIDHVWEWQDTK